MKLTTHSSLTPERDTRAGERGWALLGLILALAIMGIMLGALVPNVQFQVRRDKEAELLYRGDQMAKAIARYYNNGRLGVINIRQCPQPRGCLTELQKLKEPYMVGVNEIKLVRLSATIDPMNSGEWEPVRLRDPRLMTVLQAYASETGLVIPRIYEEMAGPPPPVILVNPDGDTPPGSGGAGSGGSGAAGSQSGNQTQNQNAPEQLNPPDPFAHFFDKDSGPGQSNIPIIGVAPKMKGPSVRTLYGLDSYEQWVFIYIPPMTNNPGGGGSSGTGGGRTGGGGTGGGPGSGSGGSTDK
jgi:uncharacterized membrane protein YgcG